MWTSVLRGPRRFHDNPGGTAFPLRTPCLPRLTWHPPLLYSLRSVLDLNIGCFRVVEEGVRRMKTMLAVLVPVLWLMTGAGSFHAADGFASCVPSCPCHSPAESEESSEDVSTVEAVAPGQPRRHRVADVLPAALRLHDLRTVWITPPAGNPAIVPSDLIGLARTWQFRLREASAPRAPSCIS